MKLVNVYAAGSNYYLTPGKDDVLIEKVRTLHQTIIDDKDYIQKEAPGYGYYSDGYTASVEESAEDSGAQSTITHVRITYMLNSGLKVERGYRLYLTPDRMPGRAPMTICWISSSTARKCARSASAGGMRASR